MAVDRRPAAFAAPAFALVGAVVAAVPAGPRRPASEGYAWKNVQMVGG